MGISIWKKPKILRRFGSPEYTDGYNLYPSEDYTVMLDVQVQSDSQTNHEDGKEAFRRLTTYGDSEIRTSKDGYHADWLWHQGRWYECVDSVLTENTWLRHYTSQFVECADQDEAPDTDAVKKGDC